MDFIYLFRLLLKKKWIIIGAAFIAAGIAYWFTRNQERQYKSSAQVSTGFTTNDEDIKLNGDNNFNFYEADTKFNNVLVTFTSQTVISLLSYTLILHDLESDKPFRVLTEEQKKSSVYTDVDIEYAKTVFRNKLDSMRMLTSYNADERTLLEFLDLYRYDYNSILKYLYVYRQEHTDYIEIDYQSENPELSAFVVNNAFRVFLRYYKTIRSQKSSESLDSLRSIVERKKQERDSKDSQLQSQGISNGDIKATSNLELIKDLETKLADEKNNQTNYYYSLQNINSRLAALGNGSTRPAVNSNNNELVILRKQRDDAYSAYLNSGSSDQSLLDKYNQLKTQYENKLLSSSTSNGTSKLQDGDNKTDLLNKKGELEVNLQAATVNIKSLETRIASLRGNVASDASQSATSQTLLNEAELADKQYLSAQESYNNALDANFSSVNNFRQILFGQPAIDPEPSKRILIVGGAGMAAFAISTLIIIFLAYLDTSVKTPAIFSKTVNLKLISMVSFMNFKNRTLVDVVTNKNVSENKNDKQRQNIFRESVRKLRYEVESSGKKIFLFTSSKKGEGKTTLIQALSFSMSLSKRRILIIDTNFCNNDLTVQLNGESLLAKINPNESSIDEIAKMATDVGVGEVFVIGCESGDFTPSEILPRENLLQHLNELKDEYDYIFLEGPPLNDFTDSKELTDYVDGVIAVFSAQRHITQIDKESIKFFKGLNGKFCGAILNKVELENVNVT